MAVQFTSNTLMTLFSLAVLLQEPGPNNGNNSLANAYEQDDDVK